MANEKSSKEKIKIKDLIRAAKRNSKMVPKKTLAYILGAGIAIIVLLVVLVGDLVNIFG